MQFFIWLIGKTGKLKEQKWQDYTQLMFYAIYFFQTYKTINTIKISYVYVEHTDIENDIILERQYLDKYIAQLKELISNTENDVDFIKNITPLCNYCDFKDYCSKDNKDNKDT